MGQKDVYYSKELIIEKADAEEIKEGEKITLMKWGNVTITRKEDGHLWGTLDEADQNFKGTKKLSWLTADSDAQLEVTLVELDHLITKKKIEESDDVSQIVNKDSRIAYQAICEKSVGALAEKTHL